ncbi:MAG TPA: cadherin domain-containing protein, partial [Roseiflexaceae bacterium]|nr:cadherin domain-containing protein [Roseiflexaceae bacterium]
MQFNSGTTKSIALQTSSPAVNLVPLADCTDQAGAALGADQRGAGRPYGPACDAGSYELQDDPTTPPVAADLSLTQSADRDPVVTGQAVTFTLTASNAGPDAAQNVVVTEEMQQFATFVSASSNCSHSGTTVTCSIGSLAAGASASVDVSLSIPFEGTMVVVGAVSSTTNDPTPTNNSQVARVTVNAGNHAPTDIALSNNSVAENSPLGTTVGTFSTTDPDTGDTHTYTLIPGFGDNAVFTISGNALQTNAALDYETKTSYLIGVRSTDAGGQWFEKVFTIDVTDVAENTNSAPTDIALSNSSVAENSPLGTTVGAFSTTDPDTGDAHTYMLVPGFGDNAAFTISGNTLQTNTALDFETKNTYQIQVRSTDAGGLSFDKLFTIAV